MERKFMTNILQLLIFLDLSKLMLIIQFTFSQIMCFTNIEMLYSNLFQSNSMIYQSAPAWSIKSRSIDDMTQDNTHKEPPTPSPNAYNPNTGITLAKSPTWKLGRQLRRQTSLKKSPGPNNYNPIQVEKSHKFGIFGHEQRIKQIISSTPGPGSYQTSRNKQNFANSFTHEPKCVVNINGFPGPGTYDACVVKERTGIKMNRQKRFTTENPVNYSPGPGDYECERSNSASHSFGKAERVQEPKKISNHIGPGQYNLRSTFDENLPVRKGYTMAARHTTKDERCSPGPARYSPTYRNLPTSPSITMSKKYKQRPSNRTPSPDQYDPKFSNSKANVESFSIGKAQKLSLKVNNFTPGPGAYLKTEYVSTGVSISLGKSRKHDEGQDFPGPGAYNPKNSAVQERPKSAKIGMSKRFQKLNTEMGPSPAFYESNINIFENPRYSFPKKKRLESKKQQLPGPGAYNIPSALCNTAPYAIR